MSVRLQRRLADFERELVARCDALRETARELREGTINPWHAANRITKLANEIASDKSKRTQDIRTVKVGKR